MTWRRAAARDEIRPGTPYRLELDGRHVALYDIDGSVHAVGDICTHEHAFLSDGYLDGDCIECPLHAALFHIPSGEVRGGPVTEGIPVYPVRIDGGEVFVDVDGGGAG